MQPPYQPSGDDASRFLDGAARLEQARGVQQRARRHARICATLMSLDGAALLGLFGLLFWHQQTGALSASFTVVLALGITVAALGAAGLVLLWWRSDIARLLETGLRQESRSRRHRN